MKPTLYKCLGCASLALLLTPKLFAAVGFTPGDIVVVQVGTGTGALAGTGTASFLDEYSLTGTLIQSIPLPTVAVGAQDALTLSGTSTSEGFLTVSGNGNFLTVGGYNQVVGGTTSGATAATVNRVIGLVNISTGSVDTSTAINSGTSGNIRSTYTSDGSSFYAASSAGGVGYVASFGGAAAALQLSASPANVRVVKAVGGQLYVTSASGAFQGLATIGTGTPTTASQTTTILPGFPTTATPTTHSSYDYWFKDANTVYVADDGTAANTGGIQKWAFSAGSWTLQYTLLDNGTTDTGVRGLSGFIDGSGNVELFGTTTATSANTVIEVTDTGANAVATTIATAGANEAFRGDYALAPLTPEPTSLALMGLGGVAGAFFFGRRNKK